MNHDTFFFFLLLSARVMLKSGAASARGGAVLLAFRACFLAAVAPQSFFLLAALTVLNFYLGHCLDLAAREGRVSSFFYPALFLNIFPLFFLKYGNFLSSGKTSDLLIPLGISFYTFSNLSYLIDISRGVSRAETHWGHFAAYSFFFPKLASGPIDRAVDFLPQLKQDLVRDETKYREGVQLLFIGLMKKFIVADALYLLVRPVFLSPKGYSAASLAATAVFARYYIYSDFSAYTDIARGSAKMLGLELSENFRKPFWSRSIVEFWQRWHISLSTWIRDYLYFPLISSPFSKLGNTFLILVSFVFLGLWHGATLNFVCYGVVNGLAIIATLKSKGLRSAWARKSGLDRFPLVQSFLQVMVVLLFVCATTILFMSKGILDALGIYGTIARGFLLGRGGGSSVPLMGSLKAFFLVVAMEGLAFANQKFLLLPKIASANYRVRWLVYLVFLMSLLVLGNTKESSRFLYFQY